MRNNIPIFVFLQALGLSRKKIIYSIKHIKTLKNYTKTNINKSTEKALIKLNEITIEQESNIKTARNFIYYKFIDQNRYNLGETGRTRINNKLYKKKFHSKTTVLRPEDILGIVNYLINLNYGIEKTDDIDDLKNKRIRTVGELLQNQTKYAIIELKKIIKIKINQIEEKITKEKNTIKINFIINQNIITNTLKKFFTNNQLSQLMEETNCLSEITHKRKISSFGIGALDRKKANLNIREIHPSQYGRICPIETTEGKNAGLILSLAQNIKINSHGFIESPFYKVVNYKIKYEKGIFFISSDQEKQLLLAPGDLKIKRSNNNKISVRKNNEFITKNIKKINYISTSTNQMISVGTALIPFLEHDDANRALMGSNMQRQAVPIIKKENAYVQTGLEKKIARNSELTKITKTSGIIKYVSFKKIIIYEKLKDLRPSFKKTNISKIKKLKKKIKQKFIKYKRKTYYLEKHEQSNQNTEILQKPSIIKKTWVKKGQVIADASSTNKGKLSIGKNLLIGYMTWEGYNFEDAVVISERLIKDEIFTSIHIKKYKTFLIDNETGEEKITNKITNVKLNDIKNLKKNGIIKNGTFISEKSILIGKVKKIKEKTLTTKILNTIFGRSIRKETSLTLPKGVKGTVLSTKIIKKKNSYLITVFVTEKRNIQLGDKIAGRHGNKGIVSKILPNEEMPYLQDGTPLDILLNPLGIPSRMNVGQIFECLLGLAAKNLKENYQILSFDEMNEKEISKKIVYNKLYEARQKTGKKWLFNPNYPGKMNIFDGKSGLKFHQPITVGYSYILKLMHLVDDKLNARLTGPYSLILKQPIRGKARNGGQRFGEMEVWAIEGFGAAYNLQELMTIKSDDITNRSKILFSIVKIKPLSKPQPTESFKSLIIEMQCLCLDISIYNKKQYTFF